MPDFDVAIIGGGLSGLAAAALLAGDGFSVAVLEKDAYPRHRVCGEYVGNESRPFLERLGLDLTRWDVPEIRRLEVSDGYGRLLHAPLRLGGFGISRYVLDATLAQLAVKKGAVLYERTKADVVRRDGDAFVVDAGAETFRARLVLGAWGKRANLDVKLQRPHLRGTNPRLDGWVGVKHHLRTEHPADLIALHNFSGGYCGISRVEDDRVCLCYLVRGAALRQAGNNIDQLEHSVLRCNPHLDRIWREAEFLFEKPVTISQVSFQERRAVEDGMLLLGDSAGLIAPLCGNGMSMAFGAAQLAHRHAVPFLQGRVSRVQLETGYETAWKQRFQTRLRVGRFLQARFGNEALTSGFLRLLRAAPFLKAPLIRATHGQPF